jgi:hypothetical protein
VIVPHRYWLAAALGLSLVQSPAGRAGEPASTVPSVNQHIAESIAGQLRHSGTLHHYMVDVAFQDGVAEISGTVADPAQREEVLRLVQAVPDVKRVIDHLTVVAPLQRVQAGLPDFLQPLPQAKEPAARPAPSQVNPPPISTLTPPAAGAPPEAVPVFQAPAPAPYDLNPPKMPPYAWPTYAPYNNYSRVAYPEAYPYNAWPFIGPIYPFPKIPPGWRSVRLEWDDGYWWFSKTATKHDWWKLRFY